MIDLRHIAAAALMGAASIVFIPGCASEPQQIPATARLSAEGTGRLTYTAPDDGMIYVYDGSSDRLIYSAPVSRGQVISVDPSNDRVLVNDRPVVEQRLVRGNDRKVYFQSGRDMDSTHERKVIHEERIERHD